MSSALGIVVVIFGLIVAVALHELGHLIPAKKFGVAVPVYSIGFGPALWSKTWGATTYSLRAILLGGYVRIVGMFAPARPGLRVAKADGRPTLAQQARLDSQAEIGPDQVGHEFYRLSAPRKIVVMMGGPVTNLLLSVSLLAVVLLGIGVATPTPTLESVAPTVSTQAGEVAGPASQAGIQPGDTLVSWAGRPIEGWADVPPAVASTDGAPAEVVLDRDGQRVEVSVTPVMSSDGRWLAGIGAGVDYEPASLAVVGQVAWQIFTGTAAIVARLPMAVWDVALSLFTDAPRDPTGVVSVVGVGRIAGEITTPVDGGGGGNGWQQTVGGLLYLLASLNMALFVFNLIPLPPLDGGHVAGAIFEGIRRTWARMRGRPDPGPADTARLMPLTYVVAGLLIAMTILLMVADVVDPVRLR